MVRGAPAEAGKWRLCLVRAFMPSLGLGGRPPHRPGPSMRTHPTRAERRARPSRPRPCPCAAVLFIVSCYLWYHRTCRKDARINEDLINCTGPARHQRLGREASKNVFLGSILEIPSSTGPVPQKITREYNAGILASTSSRGAETPGRVSTRHGVYPFETTSVVGTRGVGVRAVAPFEALPQ